MRSANLYSTDRGARSPSHWETRHPMYGGIIPPPAGWREAGRCYYRVTLAAATASPAMSNTARGGEAQQVGGSSLRQELMGNDRRGPVAAIRQIAEQLRDVQGGAWTRKLCAALPQDLQPFGIIQQVPHGLAHRVRPTGLHGGPLREEMPRVVRFLSRDRVDHHQRQPPDKRFVRRQAAGLADEQGRQVHQLRNMLGETKRNHPVAKPVLEDPRQQRPI